MRYATDGKASDEVVEAFREAQRLRAEVAASEHTLAELEKERGDISLDQERIRENMRTIDHNSELYSRYVQKLTEQETRLEDIARSLSATIAERHSRRAALEDYLATLNVD
jgi:peptidoglycan hydrolase CwlO-like protein